MYSQEKDFKPIYGSFSGREAIELVTKNTQKNMALKVPFNIGFPSISGGTKIKVTPPKPQDYGKEQNVLYSQAVVKVMSPTAMLRLVPRQKTQTNKIITQTSTTVITNGDHSSTLKPSITTQVVSSISNKSTSAKIQSRPSPDKPLTTTGSNSHISNVNNSSKNDDSSTTLSNNTANFSGNTNCSTSKTPINTFNDSNVNTPQQNSMSNFASSITAQPQQKNGLVNGTVLVASINYSIGKASVWNGVNSKIVNPKIVNPTGAIKEFSPGLTTVRPQYTNNFASGHNTVASVTGVGKEPLAQKTNGIVGNMPIVPNNSLIDTVGKMSTVWNGINGSLKEPGDFNTEQGNSRRSSTSNNTTPKDSTPISVRHVEQQESEKKNITSSVISTPSSSRRSSESNDNVAPKNNAKHEKKKGGNESKTSSGVNTPSQSNTPGCSRRSSTSNGSNTIIAPKEPVPISVKNSARQVDVDSKSDVSSISNTPSISGRPSESTMNQLNSNGAVPPSKPSTNWAVHLFSKDENQKPTIITAEGSKPNLTKPPSPSVKPQKPQKPAAPLTNGKPKVGGLAGLLKEFDPSFQNVRMRPRGLINNGNMCFMNAILQTLSHCPPFCNLLTRIYKEVAHNFNSKTPLVDSLVRFIDEYKQPKRSEGSEEFGEAFSPEYVYDALRGLKRFDSMKGRQEDAEEFLGFLLDGLHEEFLAALKKAESKNQQFDRPVASNQKDDDWMEVGRKNKASYTRTTDIEETPISRIFGGQLRSVLTCGSSDSITLQPYQSLQLDIQPDDVKTIGDALKNLTVPEYVDDFHSKSGLVRAKKCLYIETLPPILTLHLKRFIYDNVGGTQKLSKHIGYSTTLSIQPDIVAHARRPNKAVEYRLFGVVYHHGKSATGGHYTTDILCQNDWLHIDDTAISSISSEEVASVENPTQPTDRSAYILFYMKN